MPRPLPATTPPRLIELLGRQNLTDLSALAERAGVSPKTAQEMVTTAKLRPLAIYRKLARALGVSLEELYPILTADDTGLRKQWFDDRMNERGLKSQKDISRISGIHSGTISAIISGKNSCGPFRTYKAVSEGLAIDLEEFAELF